MGREEVNSDKLQFRKGRRLFSGLFVFGLGRCALELHQDRKVQAIFDFAQIGLEVRATTDQCLGFSRMREGSGQSFVAK